MTESYEAGSSRFDVFPGEYQVIGMSAPVQESVPPPEAVPPRRPAVVVPVILFLLTCASCWFAGTLLYQGDSFAGMQYAAALMSILLGMAFGGLLATVLRAGAIILLGTLLFNIHYQVTDFLALFAVFTLTMAALYGLGMMLASVFLLFGREAWQIADALREPIYFVSGFYFPVRALGFPVALAASVLPMTLGLDAMRQLSFGNGPALGFLTLGVEIAVLAALTVLFGIGAKVALEVVERKAIQEGTLTDRNR